MMPKSMACFGRSALTAAVVLTATPAICQPEQVVEVSSRNQQVRALLLVPDAPSGSIILLAGGNGNLLIGKQGNIGWGAGNQLVRTRANYAKAGFATLVPDIARDLKLGRKVVPRYRWSNTYARDIGEYIKYMRGIAAPVYLVGTSRAALSVAKAAAYLGSGPERPDAIVITSGMLVHVTDTQPSVQRKVRRLAQVTQPVLLLYHEKDACPYTLPASSGEAKALFESAKKVDVVMLKGGSPGSGNPCQANSHHGFAGQDDEVVRTVADWLGRL